MIYESLGNYLQIPIGSGKNQSYNFDINDFCNAYNLSLLEVFNTIQLMEREGYIATSEALSSPSKIHIKAGREDLYRFQIEYQEFDTIIKYMLRNLPGVLSDFVNIREETISIKTGLSVEMIIKQIERLEKLDFLTYIPRNDKPQIFYLTERLNISNISLSEDVYKNRKEDADRRLQSVIDFVNNDEICRSVQLLRYFGENIKNTCGRCDVCSSRNRNDVDNKEYKIISDIIISELKENSAPIYEVVNNIKTYKEEKIVETIRWMVDNNIIRQDDKGKLSI